MAWTNKGLYCFLDRNAERLHSDFGTKISEERAALGKLCAHRFTRAKVQKPTDCLRSQSGILCNCITRVAALTRNLMLQWLIVELILAALVVATQPNLHIIESYIAVQEEQACSFAAQFEAKDAAEVVYVCL